MSEPRILNTPFNTSGRKSIGLVPRGRQLFRCIAAEHGLTQVNKHNKISQRLEVVYSPDGPHYRGRSLVHSVTLIDEAEVFITQMIRAFARGDSTVMLLDPREVAQLCLGRLVSGEVIHEQTSGGKGKRVRTFAKLDFIEAATPAEVRQYGDNTWNTYFGRPVYKPKDGAASEMENPGAFQDDDIPF